MLDQEDLVELSAVEGTPEQVLQAMVSQDADRAAALAGGCKPGALKAALMPAVLSDRLVRPVYVAHAIKQVVAAHDDALALGSPLPMQAAVRFLACRHQERRVSRSVFNAIELVAHGKVPRLLGM